MLKDREKKYNQQSKEKNRDDIGKKELKIVYK